MDCLFCKIIKGEIPCAKIYEDESIFAFKDISPQAPTHILFVPKVHVDSLVELQPTDIETVGRLYAAVRRVAHDLGLSKRGFRTVVNTKQEGGQTVFHLHVHLLGGKTLGGNMSGLSR